MLEYDFLAQATGIIAMGFNVFSYQCKSQKGLVTCQLFGTLLFAINYFMLGAVVGGFLDLIGAFRSVVFMFRKKFRADSIYWVVFFCAFYVLTYILNFTVFGETFTIKTCLLEILPVVSMITSTIAFYVGNAAVTRKLGYITSPTWLIYNFVIVAIGGIVCEVLCLCSVIIGIIRYDIKRKVK